jgi:hypothetical protein
MAATDKATSFNVVVTGQIEAGQVRAVCFVVLVSLH